MNYFDEIRLDLEETKKMIKEANRRIKNAPSGTLKITPTKYGYQYLKVVDKKRIYLRKADFSEVRQLANKQYCLKAMKRLENKKKILEKFLENEEKINISVLYENLYKQRQKLVERLDITDEDFADSWQQKHYASNNFRPEDLKFKTNRGDFVRSKSEKIIADKLFAKKIPYKYEIEVRTKNGKFLYPDFAILNKRTRKLILFEHFGMLDNKEYLLYSLKKIEDYAQIGFVLGKNFVFTYETNEKPFSEVLLERIISDVLNDSSHSHYSYSHNNYACVILCL